MAIQKHRIILTADIQYKDRTYNLKNSYEKISEAIEKVLIDTKADIFVGAGDFCEVATPNDSERSMMFKHLGNLLNIGTLKELVLMNGNHDILTGKKVESSQKENNPLDTFVKTTQAINPEISKKINYLKKQKEYESIVSNLISWVSYSIEDGSSSGSNLHLNNNLNGRYRIPVFHDILRDFAEDSKLPLTKSKMESLMKLEDFKVNPNQKALVLAGDIHQQYSKIIDNTENTGTIHFMYPGEPIQRNHGMGSYYKVRSIGPQVIKASPKYVKQIDLFLDDENIENSYYELSDIELPNTLHYIKIDLNNKKFVDNWKEQLEHLISQIEVSNYTNICKLEISNIYMKYEMEILTMINNYFEKKNQQSGCINYIELSYGTVIFDKDDITIDDEVNDLEDDEDSKVDDIVLNQEKLKTIFEKILDANNKNILKEFTNPEEFTEIIEELQSLFDEQIDLTYGNSKSYKTEFQKVIIKNGFMALGANDINLDIPGLTRIVGNNGIGKTTLFNILRWIIKGNILEGLPKNTKKENLLLVFNDELPEQDYMVNTLYLIVNDIPVEIERNAKRTWKTKTTLEDKKSINWKTFIDTATTNLTLRVYPKDRDVVIKMNDEAQAMINQWFGNTIETIFILNQFKILQLLNSSGDELKEAVLEYIGVDYTKSLIGNLEIIKPNYVVNKPEKTQMDIVVEKNKTTQLILENNQKLEDLKIIIESTNSSKDIVSNNINVKNQELINLGNVPEKLKEISIELESNKTNLSSFEFKEIKELPIFSEIQPIKPQDEIDSYETNLLESKNSEEKYQKEIDTNIKSLNELKNNKVKIIEENLSKLKSDNESILIFGKNTFTNKHNEILPNLKENKTELLKLLSLKLNDSKNIFTENIRLQQEKLNIDKQSRNEVILKINNLRSEINNDICTGCKRPIGLTPEIIEEKENQIIDFDASKDLLTEIISKLENEINNDKIEISNIDVKLKDISLLLNWNNSYTSQEDFLSEIKIINDNLEIFYSSDVDMITKEIVILLNEGINNWNEFNNLDKNEILVKNIETINKFSKLISILVTINIDTEITEELEQIKFLSEFFDKIRSNTELKKLQSTQTLLIKNIENELKTIVDKYNLEISEFNQKQTNHNRIVTEINEYNTSIIDHNKLKTEYENNINRLTKDYDTVNSQIYYFEKYNKELTEFNLELKTLTDNIESYKNQQITIDKNNILFDENIKTLNELEDKWKLYRKKNFIYKTYEKLIKSDFKMAIFNYYRTFLNNKLNILLEGLDFRLYWNNDSNLYLTKFSKNNDGNTEMTYRPVKLASGAQTMFLGLSLIYSFHLLNVKNSLSHIFIDEISGQLNNGKNNGLGNDENDVIDDVTMKNYQNQLVYLLSKKKKKKVFIVDHVIEQLYETYTYYVKRQNIDGVNVTIYE